MNDPASKPASGTDPTGEDDPLALRSSLQLPRKRAAKGTSGEAQKKNKNTPPASKPERPAPRPTAAPAARPTRPAAPAPRPLPGGDEENGFSLTTSIGASRGSGESGTTLGDSPAAGIPSNPVPPREETLRPDLVDPLEVAEPAVDGDEMTPEPRPSSHTETKPRADIESNIEDEIEEDLWSARSSAGPTLFHFGEAETFEPSAGEHDLESDEGADQSREDDEADARLQHRDGEAFAEDEDELDRGGSSEDADEPTAGTSAPDHAGDDPAGPSRPGRRPFVYKTPPLPGSVAAQPRSWDAAAGLADPFDDLDHEVDDSTFEYHPPDDDGFMDKAGYGDGAGETTEHAGTEDEAYDDHLHDELDVDDPAADELAVHPEDAVYLNGDGAGEYDDDEEYGEYDEYDEYGEYEDDEDYEEEEEPDETAKREAGLPLAGHVTDRKGWGYTFVIATLFTMFGSITIATYFVVMNTNASIPNIMVNVSVFALLFFILILFNRYFVLIFLSFLHHVRIKDFEELRDDYEPLKATVLVPAYNEGVVIEQSIESLLKLNYPNFEILVINDGSSDDTLEKARLWEGMHDTAEVRVLTQRNKGKAAALNHGAAMATGDVVVCMDGDSRLTPDTLNAGMRYFDDPEVGAVAGNVKVINRRNVLTRLQALEYVEGLNLVRRAQAYLNAVNIVPGPIGLFRRDILLQVGGWDTDTFAEDCDLTLKILTSGYKIEYEPYAISETEAPETLIPLLKQRYRWTRGILQSMRKHRSFLINPDAGWRVVLTMWQMVLEGILWPLMNILANFMFILVAFLFGMSPLLVLWWVQLTILDTIAALHALAIEREDLTLVPYAVVYRLVFIQIVDVTKMLATIEELLGIKMGWGKLERKGRLNG